MATREGWRHNANETQVTTGFNMGVAQVGTVGSLGWGGLRWLARRLGLPVAEPRPEPAGPAVVACTRCGTLVLAGEAACGGCGRALPPRPATTAAQIAALAEAADRRQRRDLAVALLTGLGVGVGILVVAQTMERGLVQALGVQLWWLAGVFWGLVVYVSRRWLDQ